LNHSGHRIGCVNTKLTLRLSKTGLFILDNPALLFELCLVNLAPREALFQDFHGG
jgi:hypothetical protein